jgi:pimeloyl-ACP methyl ester carboxylesterase
MCQTRLFLAAALGAILMVLAGSPASRAQPTKCTDLAAGKCTIDLPTGITMAYVDTGPAPGTPIILIHGFTDSIRTWSFAEVPLRKAHPGWRILAVDLRGHGASSMPPAAMCAATPERCFHPRDFATDVVAFMRAMGIERANLVGHSLGSLIVQEVALSNPAMVERAVLVGTTTKVVDNPVIRDFLLRDTIEGKWKPAMEAKGKKYPDDLYNMTLQEMDPNIEEWLITTWGADPVEYPPWLATYGPATVGMHVGPWIGGCRALLTFDNTTRLEDLKVPTLVIWGTQDAILLNDPDQMAIKRVLAIAAKANHTTNYWKQYGLLPLPASGSQETDIGHTVQEDAPDLVAADIGAFFTTGAPTKDLAHSDKAPNVQKILVERDKAPVERFGQ